MIIEEPDFKLIPTAGTLFDLELLYIIKPKNGKPRKEFKNAGYGMTLIAALKKIIHYRIECKYPNKTTLPLKNYIKILHQEYNKLLELVPNEERN